MALRRNVSKRLFNFTAGRISAGKSNSKGDSGGLLRRILQRRTINQSSFPGMIPEFFTLSIGDKMREKLKMERIRLDGLAPPAAPVSGEVTVEDARRMLRVWKVERLKKTLREMERSTVTYTEYVRVCVEECENDESQGLEFAKFMDESGNVVVVGNVVFLRPEQVAKSMETLVTQSLTLPNDPRKQELEQLEHQKAQIDKKAQKLVKRELYCGLGLLMGQTLGFMRLTFWELSWDVMEPICFFVTSFHFLLTYAFFLRTSIEPSFRGYFQQRFLAKQAKLMKIYHFDLAKYTELRRRFDPLGGGADGWAVFGALRG